METNRCTIPDTVIPECATTPGPSSTPTYERFIKALVAPMKKAGHYSAPVLYNLIPNSHKRVLYESIKYLMKHPDQIPNRFLETSLWTLHKKGDRRKASNYRPISIPHPIYRIITKLKKDEVLYRLDKQIGQYQHGFRPSRTCGTGIFQVRRFRSKFKNPISLMLDVKKAFDSIPHTHLLKVLANLVDDETYQLVKRLYSNGTKGHILGTNKWYTQTCGVRQGCQLSPILFDVSLDSALKNVKLEKTELMVSFADDISLHGANMAATKKLLKKVTIELEKIGLTTDPQKSEAVGRTEHHTHIRVGEKDVPLQNSGRLLGQYIGTTTQHCTKVPLEELRE